MTHEVISEVLIESAGSPLRKALVDSGLGEDLSPVSGLESDLREDDLRRRAAGNRPRKGRALISALILDTLSALCSQGLDPMLVQSMINRVEFRHREIRGSGSPYALRLMGRALRGWVHGLDPFSALQFSPVMAELKARLAADPRHLEKVMEKSFLSNHHRLTLVVRPDREQEPREAAEDTARLAALVAAMTPSQKEEVLSESRAFRVYQLAPDSARVPRPRAVAAQERPAPADRAHPRAGRTHRLGGVPRPARHLHQRGRLISISRFPPIP